jgi:tetratricopeptide (TPR) repeat protein
MEDVTGDSPTLASGLSGAGQVVAGRYHLRARLGRGAWKEVYLAYDERLDREVALAIVVGAGGGAAARARVEREAHVTGRLGDHPNVITVHDTGELDGVPYLVLRAMPGGSLADAPRLAIADTVRLGREIAAALAHAHAHGVVHRDVKPDNVWLAADGTAALGDFGVAYEIDGDRLTAEGAVVGTARYLSPEQARGDPIGPRSDLYALGVTLYELLTGRPPFRGDGVEGVIAQHLTATPVAPSRHEPAIPPALDALVLELLAKDPVDRPASAAAVADALGAIVVAAPAGGPREEARRWVTVLAVRAAAADPEVLHGLLARCARRIERFGGIVERERGDSLIGLFGAAGAREDDALRAAQAALELRAAEGTALRLAVDCGEAFVGTTFATGEPIAATARRAQEAPDGEILLGAGGQQALAATAQIDAPTGRLLGLHAAQPVLRRAFATPFVGRDRELEALRGELERAREQRGVRVVTVVGSPGMGKSRLARELVAGAGASAGDGDGDGDATGADAGDEATVLVGSCLPYGEGSTRQVLGELLGQLGGDPRERVGELLAGSEHAAERVLAAAGLVDGWAPAEEASWAVRKLLERLARDRPLIVAIEDVHWAEPTLLDLLDYVATFSTGAPILLLCLARPELLDARPAWAAPQAGRSLVVLEPLPDGDAHALVAALGGGERITRIVRTAEGNPLFLEQLVAVDEQGHDATLPTSIHGVLAARVDGLAARERSVLRHAAVEGRTFHAGAIVTLMGEEQRGAVEMSLVALARKGLVRAGSSALAGEDAFVFDHALIRDAAYMGIPKRAGATLHEGVANWLEAHADAPQESVGHHLERAFRLREELGDARSGRGDVLAARAAARFQTAARATLQRGDAPAASRLLERAVTVLAPGDPARAELAPVLGAALFEAGRLADAERVLAAAIAAGGDERLTARARVEQEFVALQAGTARGTAQARAVAEAALRAFEAHDDARGRCRAWCLLANAAWTEGRVAVAEDAWRNAAAAARSAGDERELFEILGWHASAAAFGPAPVTAAIARCEEIRDQVRSSPLALAATLHPLAALHAMAGEDDAACALVREAGEILRDLGGIQTAVSHHEALVELIAGRPGEAEQRLRAGYETLDEMGDSLLLSTTAAMLAQAVLAQGRAEEAEALTQVSERTTAADDIVTQAIWRGTRARALAGRGRHDEARLLAEEAVALLARTDLLNHRADALCDLAEVLRLGGSGERGQATLSEALALYEEKQNFARIAQVRSRLTNEN